MANGPGKYDDICTVAREQAAAAGVLLIVLGGKHGNGFSCQTDPVTLAHIPEMLRMLADEIEKDRREVK